MATSISIRAPVRLGAQTWRYLGLILVLQLGLTLLDPTPRYLMGDSASYLWSVFHDGPYDRSWTYPAWFLGPILSLRSAKLVVFVQCALGVIPAWVAFGLVSGRDGRRRNVIALAAACLCLIEPLALIYQRFFLTDSLGLVTVAAAVFFCVGIIDGSAATRVYAALAPPSMVLAASLRSSQIPSLAFLCAITLLILLFIRRDYRASAFMAASLVLFQLAFSHYALEYQGVRGYNAASGRFLLAAVLPIVSRADVEPYIDPAQTPAILDDKARDRRWRPAEMFKPGLATDQIQHATEKGTKAAENVKRENRLASHIAIHALLRDPVGFIDLAWLGYLDYFDEPWAYGRVLEEAGNQEFVPGVIPLLAEHGIDDVVDTASVQTPVRSYFEAAWRYYALIPAISTILLAGCLLLDRRPSTLTLAAFALASGASQLALSTEPVPRYLIVAAWVNIVAAGRIACVLAPRLSSDLRRPVTEAIPGSEQRADALT